MEKIAAVVVLFNPNYSVFDNITTYLDNIHSLYIVDNSPVKHGLCKKILVFRNVKVIHSGENIGMAKALNLALKYAYKDNYKWLMTLDQDTSFSPKEMNMFLESFYNISKIKTALVSPLHNQKFIKTNLENPFIEKEYVMTSANIVNVSIAKKLGGYDEKLFIDEVDHEFCFRLKENSYIILQNCSIAVNHALGSKNKIHTNITIYDPIRLYYMTRNYLYLKKKYYHQHQQFFKQRDGYLLKFFRNQLFYGKNPLKNIRMIFRGILDYKNNQFGEFRNEP